MRKIFLFLLLISTLQSKPINIVGVTDKNILKLIHQQITNTAKNPTDTERQLLTKYNINQIYKVLYSFGYFDSQITSINPMTFNIKLNNRYKLNDVDFKFSSISNPPGKNIIDIKKNSYINTKQIANSVKKIRNYYQQLGFGLIDVKQPAWEINKQNKTITVTFVIDLGPKIYIKNNVINIKSRKNPQLLKPFINNRITWKEGDVYNLDKLNDFKDKLIKYDLFSSIDISLGNIQQQHNNCAYADIIINVEEAPVKEHKLSTKLSTSNIYELEYSWQHHNIDGRGSTIELLGVLSKNTKEARALHSYYDLFYKNQELNTQIFCKKENTEAYNTTKFGIGSTLWQTLSTPISIGIGLALDRSKTIDKTLANDDNKTNDITTNIDELKIDDSKNENVKNTDITDNKIPYTNIVSPFFGLKFNNTNNELDPQRGIKVNLEFNPHFSPNGHYSNITGKLSNYFTSDKYTLATYIKYGKILSTNTSIIPKDKLYFSGGADSIRGYGYQKLGPLNKRTPVGGNALLEFCIEPRMRINNTLGIAAFIEAGKIYNPTHNLMWGFGLGVIYYTQLSPIRIDLAFPTKRRKDNNGKYIDSLFHFYVSIGQAF